MASESGDSSSDLDTTLVETEVDKLRNELQQLKERYDSSQTELERLRQDQANKAQSTTVTIDGSVSSQTTAASSSPAIDSASSSTTSMTNTANTTCSGVSPTYSNLVPSNVNVLPPIRELSINDTPNIASMPSAINYSMTTSNYNMPRPMTSSSFYPNSVSIPSTYNYSLPTINNNVSQPLILSNVYPSFAPMQSTSIYSMPTNNNTSQPITSSAPFTSNYHQSVSSLNQCQIPFSRKLIDLPEFNGSPEQWPMFVTAYSETTTAHGYTNLENLMRLQKALKGPAKQEVEALLIHPNSVNNILNALEFRFGRRDIIIRAQLAKARNYPAVTKSTDLVGFSTFVSNLTVFLQNANAGSHLTNPTLLDELVGKLYYSKREEWVKHLISLGREPTIVDFNGWLHQMSMYVSLAVGITPKESSNLPKERLNKNKSIYAVTEKKPFTPKKCLHCQGDHFLNYCYKFKKLPVLERWKLVKGNKLCFGCLAKGHSLYECSKKKTCNVNDCTRMHNSLLHSNEFINVNEIQTEQSQMENIQQSEPVSVGIIQNPLTQSLLKYVPVRLYGPRGFCDIIAFIDDGAKISLLEENIAEKLGIKGVRKNLSLKWIGEHTTSEMSSIVNLDIKSFNPDASPMHMKGVRTIKKLLLPKQTLNVDDFKSNYNSLSNIPLLPYTDRSPQMLIGLSHTEFIRPIKFINFENGFAVHKTKLGWILFGSNTDRDPLVAHVHLEDENLADIREQMNDYFTIENFGIKSFKPIRSDDDVRSLNILEQTTRYIDGSYETGLLWNDDTIEFPPSYESAYKRLINIEKKMSKDENLADWYTSKINEYVDKGYARKLTTAEVTKENPRTFYLPHFATSNINKGNKLRLVFDAAASVNGESLNSKLLKGPDVYQPTPLIDILMRFRESPIAVCGDIREMYHRVKIQREDQDSQRFLWRKGDMTKTPDVYVMQVMTFGATCSPCSAQYVKNQHALKFSEDMPRAVKAIIERHYVDDFVDSFPSIEEAIRITKQVKEIHRSANFIIRGFISNSEEVVNGIEDVPLSKNPPNQIHNFTMSDTEKVLGLYWNPGSDSFSFKVSLKRTPIAVLEGTMVPTKRQILSAIMSIYDPLGFLANITIQSKLIMQELWKSGIGWNDKISEDLYQKWLSWHMKLRETEKFQMTRCYDVNFMNPAAKVQLHIFADASELAYSAVCFWRVEHEGVVNVAFALGKSRCAPMKALSIPRLELQAALLATRLKETLINVHRIKSDSIYLWSDSKTVIQWIHSDTRRYKQFVSHRISEILDSTLQSQWRWVPGKWNPADEATRCYKNEFSNSSTWLNGPEFLKLDDTHWPKLPTNLTDHDIHSELKSHAIVTVSPNESLFDYARYSSFFKLLRVISLTIKAVCKFKGAQIKDANVRKSCLITTASDFNDAKILLCKLVQMESFSQEVKKLKNNEPINKGSPIYNLTPFLNSEGLLCVGSRIRNANCIPLYSRQPIILPKSHVVSKLICLHYHNKFHHQNQESIICAIRSKFWIPHVRSLVRGLKNTCQQCKIDCVKPAQPQMGQLPIDRLTPFVRVFSYCGLDYFGPLDVSIGRRKEKRWVALFTCLTVRAIHLEIAKDLSADSTVLCLRNFMNRRGVPIRIRSDCGTNFISASKMELVVFNEQVERECAKHGIEWIFNAPCNPSAGGTWERMVRCVKRVLKHCLKEKSPQIETLQSFLMEAENIVNSRPLTHIPIESTDEDPLTPNHFLLGCPNLVQTPAVDENICVRKQWQILQQMKQAFWKRWMLEYIPTLTKRTKWFDKVDPIKKGDIVLICDEKEARGSWRRGEVIEADVARDGQVRTALIRTTSGTLRRPASKLAKLDILGESPASASIHGGRDVAY